MVNLKNGISILYDLELNNYFMTCVIKKIKQVDSKLCKEKTIAKKSRIANSYSIGECIGITMGICGCLGLVAGIVLAILDCKKFTFDYSLLSLIQPVVLVLLGAIVGALACGIAGIVIGLIIGIIGKCVEQKNVNAYNKNIEYEYSKEVKAEKDRIAREAEQRKFLRDQIKIVQNKLNESNNVLTLVYNTVGIDHTFRNLICMGYMDEYIRLGIATKLEGVDGLYYVIKQQLNFDQINANLNIIIDKLDVIIDKQTKIYHAIQALNTKCVSMVSELEKISYNTYSIAYDSAVNTYSDERAQQEASYLNYINGFN